MTDECDCMQCDGPAVGDFEAEAAFCQYVASLRPDPVWRIRSIALQEAAERRKPAAVIPAAEPSSARSRNGRAAPDREAAIEAMSKAVHQECIHLVGDLSYGEVSLSPANHNLMRAALDAYEAHRREREGQ